MRSIFTKRLRRYSVVALTLVTALPVLSGCSTLGIATTDEMSAMTARVDSTNQSNSTRIDGVEKNTADMQTTLTQMSASVDTLNSRFARASDWLRTMNIDTITEDSRAATNAATEAEARIQTFLTHYLEWLKAQQAAVEQQITAIDAAMKASPAGTSKKPADSGGDNDSSSDGGGK